MGFISYKFLFVLLQCFMGSRCNPLNKLGHFQAEGEMLLSNYVNYTGGGWIGIN